jgi:hypothetical protein
MLSKAPNAFTFCTISAPVGPTLPSSGLNPDSATQSDPEHSDPQHEEPLPSDPEHLPDFRDVPPMSPTD